MHHTKEKGDLGVLMAQADLCRQGWLVLHPMTEHAPFDLVAYRNGNFRRVQVKYRRMVNGQLEVKFQSMWADKRGNHVQDIDKGKIDLICVYCPDTEKCYYFDPKDFRSSVRLRVEKAKNGQRKGINLAESYTLAA